VKNVTAKEVKVGDVLLFHGDALISKLIRFFDGTDVNHAAICIGTSKIGEAQAKGLATSTIDAGLKSPEYIIVRRLKAVPDTMQPVVDRAEYYLNIGNRYAYAQILLLAFLGITRKLAVNPYLKWLLRKVLDNAADWLTSNGDRQPMICSEYVYRCYDEAWSEQRDAYSINIEPFPSVSSGRTRGVRALAGPLPRRNIQRESLAAWVEKINAGRGTAANTALLRSIREAPSRGVSRSLSTEERKMASMPLDDLIDGYLNEARKPVTRSLVQKETLRTPEILAGIEKFSGALHSAAKPAAISRKLQTGRSAEEQAAENLSFLLKAVPDFITPGDLLKCADLSSIGQISPESYT
jgi:hypothetical protein